MKNLLYIFLDRQLLEGLEKNSMAFLVNSLVEASWYVYFNEYEPGLSCKKFRKLVNEIIEKCSSYWSKFE